MTDALHTTSSVSVPFLAGESDIALRETTIRADRRYSIVAVDANTRLVAISLVSYLNEFQHDLKAVCDLAHGYRTCLCRYYSDRRCSSD